MSEVNKTVEDNLEFDPEAYWLDRYEDARRAMDYASLHLGKLALQDHPQLEFDES